MAAAGFAVERLTFSAPGTPDVDNLFATIGSGAPHLVFAGHTDVVPPGDEARWSHPPFAGEIAGGMLYGRGAVDMKGGIACFMAAALDKIAAEGKPAGTLSLLITGDEEGPSINGTVKALAWALEQGHRFDAALVGEPTSRADARRHDQDRPARQPVGDDHASPAGRATSPIPILPTIRCRAMIRILDRLARCRLDEGNADFEPSNLEVTSVDVGNPAFNVIPAEARASFNVRFNDRWTIGDAHALPDAPRSTARPPATRATLIELHRRTASAS